MSFQLFYLPSYERCLKKLGAREKGIASLIVAALLDYFQSSPMLGGAPYLYRSEGRSWRLVFKKLRPEIWEAYLEGKVRVLTRSEKDHHYLVFVGNHDQVRQFLKKH